MKNIFANFFSDTSEICGHEKTFHANFCHHLLCSGLDEISIAREHRINKAPVDVVLFAEKNSSGWSTSNRPRIAIEFKGGAYGSRNALRDTVDINGHCSDLDKLLSYKQQGLECWFVCIDIAELGISLSYRTRQRLAKCCASLGINFAYHAQKEKEFIFCKDGKQELCELKNKPTYPLTHNLTWQAALPYLEGLMHNQAASEDTYTSLLYHALRRVGLSAKQLSLETYFCCAKGTARMHKRPDLCVFSAEVEGHFNLYRNGNTQLSNDGKKIGNLSAVIEIKGSSATIKYSDTKFCQEIASDIEKLCNWRTRFHESGYLSTSILRKQPDFVMLALDKRARPMQDATLESLRRLASINNIHFNYLHG